MLSNKVITTFGELTCLVQEFRRDGAWVFRGVRESTYELVPKIGRPEARKLKGTGENLPYDRVAEETLTLHFIRSAAPYVSHVPRTRLEWLALAQHHGMFTRLLDWSESLLVAAYFAVEDARNLKSNPVIYCIRDVPTACDILHDEIEKLDDVVLYYPPHISPRIPAQSALFTVHKRPNVPFRPQNMFTIEIAESPLTIKLDLNACGIHKESLFPDINGLAEHQSWLYKWGEHKLITRPASNGSER